MIEELDTQQILNYKKRKFSNGEYIHILFSKLTNQKYDTVNRA